MDNVIWMAIVAVATFILACQLTRLVLLSPKVGSRVWHKVYGAGTVLSKNQFGRWEVEFDLQGFSLENKWDANMTNITRFNCLEWFDAHDPKLHIIKRTA